MAITRIYSGLQSYVHFKYSNYKYDEVRIKTSNFKKQLETRADLQSLENSLNKYFIKSTSGDMMGEVPDEVLQYFYQVIDQKFSREDMSKINLETLGGPASKYALHKQQEFDRLIKLGSQYFNKKTIIKAIKEINKRIPYLIESDGKKDIVKKFNDIKTIFKKLNQDGQREMKWWHRSNKEVDELATLIAEVNKMLASGRSTVHGAYAEYIVALMSAVGEEKGQKTVDEIIRDFKDNLINIGGAKTQATFSTKNFFGLTSEVTGTKQDVQSVVSEVIGKRHQYYDADSNIVYTSNITQDKVDVDIKFNGVNLPVSVKNINLNHPTIPDISLLHGTGILALLDQEAKFVNHWLNISPERVGNDVNDNASASDKKRVDDDMKLLIAYRSLAGGRSIVTGKAQLAKVFVVNDNSTGKFKVFRIYDLLNDIEKDLNFLNITTEPDIFNLKNKWIGVQKELSAENAYRRVIDLLAKLNAAKISVSINKNIIQKAFSI